MATTWYFRGTDAPTGPTGFPGGLTDNFPSVPADKNTPKDMTADSGSGQTSVAGTYNNAGSAKWVFMRMFISPALSAQTLTGGQAGYKIAVGIKESSGNMNLYGVYRAYVWRSVSGAVKYILGSGVAYLECPTEHGTSETECVVTASGAAGDFSIEENDRIVVELWGFLSNSKSTDYTATFYYDGTDTTMVDDTATSNAGSYFYCPQTLNLSTGGVSIPIITETINFQGALD